jgi:transcriptional regulator with XRE-family HTH domain
MNIGGNEVKSCRPARKRIDVSVGDSVRIIRELQGYSQNGLARLTGIPQATLSAVENDRIDISKRRAEQLAKAFKAHSAIIMFPEYEGDLIQRAA